MRLWFRPRKKMAHYVAQVSTLRSYGAVMVDLGECASVEAAREKFVRIRLCLNNDSIKVEITEAAEVPVCDSQNQAVKA